MPLTLNIGHQLVAFARQFGTLTDFVDVVTGMQSPALIYAYTRQPDRVPRCYTSRPELEGSTASWLVVVNIAGFPISDLLVIPGERTPGLIFQTPPQPWQILPARRGTHQAIQWRLAVPSDPHVLGMFFRVGWQR